MQLNEYAVKAVQLCMGLDDKMHSADVCTNSITMRFCCSESFVGYPKATTRYGVLKRCNDRDTPI